MTELIPPSLDMWVFAGAGGGALLTWMIMRMAGRNAYQHGYDHGRSEIEHAQEERLAALEQERGRLQEALARAHEERARLLGLLAAVPASGPDPAPPGPPGA